MSPKADDNFVTRSASANRAGGVLAGATGDWAGSVAAATSMIAFATTTGRAHLPRVIKLRIQSSVSKWLVYASSASGTNPPKPRRRNQRKDNRENDMEIVAWNAA